MQKKNTLADPCFALRTTIMVVHSTTTIFAPHKPVSGNAKSPIPCAERRKKVPGSTAVQLPRMLRVTRGSFETDNGLHVSLFLPHWSPPMRMGRARMEIIIHTPQSILLGLNRPLTHGGLSDGRLTRSGLQWKTESDSRVQKRWLRGHRTRRFQSWAGRLSR